MPFEMIRRQYPGCHESIRHAEDALPILVYYATVLKRPISYTELADRLGTYYRHLGTPLGFIGRELLRLRGTWDENLPLIQFLIHGKNRSLPAKSGLNWLMADLIGRKSKRKVSRDVQLAAVETVWGTIFKYGKWDEVLHKFGMKQYKPPVPNLPAATTQLGKRYGHGTGESPSHLRLKYFVSQHPGKLKLPKQTALVTMEYQYPSMDKVDVLFHNGDQTIAVEVKPKSADEFEITRGMYQCVKYLALSHAVMVGDNIKPMVRALLVLEGGFPTNLRWLRKALEIEVIDKLEVPAKFKLPPGAKPSTGTPDEQD